MSDTRERDREPDGYTRRSFLKGAGVAAGGITLTGAAAASAKAPAAAANPAVARLSGEIEVELTVNGTLQKVTCEPRTTLLGALRDRCRPPLTGTKLVCDHGSCGACTVLVDGEPACSCLMLAVDAHGRQVRTVEGLAPEGELSPLQEAFVEHDALMCGFCTPGFVMSLTGCLEKNPGADITEIRSACAGNLCRCGTYPHIFDAALAAGRRMGRGGAK
jgi:aerobic-type carbon monoxide dehydrogenase small subunit (CoxS/CutS family)